MRNQLPGAQCDGRHPLDARFEELTALSPTTAAEDAPVPFIEREPVAAVPIRTVVGHEPRREELHEVGWLLWMPLGKVRAQRFVQVFLVVIGRLESMRRVARVVLAVVHVGRGCFGVAVVRTDGRVVGESGG